MKISPGPTSCTFNRTAAARRIMRREHAGRLDRRPCHLLAQYGMPDAILDILDRKAAGPQQPDDIALDLDDGALDPDI